MEPVYILGGGRTDFKRNLKKEGKTIRNLITEAGKKALDDAKIDPAEIQAGAVGNFNAGQFTKQLHLGAFIPEIDPKLHGIPTMHTEAACASGALSVLLGAHWIMGGFHDAVLVVGAEQQKTMSSLDGSDVLGAAADYHIEKPEYGDFMFPKLFARIVRFEAVMDRMTRGPGASWTDTAHRYGYHDQMHMVHDIQRFTGETPTRILPVFQLVFREAIDGLRSSGDPMHILNDSRLIL